MREDVLKIVTSAKDVTNAVILTHNIDFVFVQSVVIPALRKCGSPTVTIFADGDLRCSDLPIPGSRSQRPWRALSGGACDDEGRISLPP